MYYYGYECIRETDISHHGILGQKWGKRNGPPYPIDAQDHSASEKKAGWRKSLSNGREEVRSAKEAYKNKKKEYNKAYRKSYYSFNPEDHKDFQRKTLEKQYAKEDLANAKWRALQNTGKTNKSKHRTELEKYYRDRGMSESEAELAAYKRDCIEKTLMIAGGVTLAVATAYAIKNYRDIHVDKIIKPGTKLSRIAASDDPSVRDGFYAVFNNNAIDKANYKGMYAVQLKLQGNKDIYQKVISLPEGVKMASEQSATNALKELYSNDKDFRRALRREMEWMELRMPPIGKQGKIFKKASAALKNGKIDRNVYRAFNLSLVDKMGFDADDTWTNEKKKLFEALKSKGYGAIMDINDRYLSGYDTNAPIIVFDSSSAKVDTVRRVTNPEFVGNAAVAIGRAQVHGLKQPANAIPIAAAVGIKGYSAYSKNKRNDKIVQEYRREHPNTQLSYQEIVRNYEREAVNH